MANTKEMDEYMLNLLDELKEVILRRNKEEESREKLIKAESTLFLSEAAKLIKCSDSKLRDLIRRNEGPKYFKVGSRYLFRESKVIEWMKEQEKNNR